uniref:BZIP domain-containing protein n=1 Tax=Aegilops tauschii subsp. strangulata TaxID=200361 RepID=A0A453CB59_AEGTS
RRRHPHSPPLPRRRSPAMDAPPASTSASAAGSASASASQDAAAEATPRRPAGHRRAQSEILLGATALPDDLTFDADLGVVGEGSGGGGDEDDDDEYEEDEQGGGGGSGGSRMFEMFLQAGGRLSEPLEPSPYPQPTPQPARPRHQHSMSMDGSTSFGSASSGVSGRHGADAKKAISDAKLAELALVDPKRAKRIMANRQSAARSKERKMRYIAELERKVQCLQTEATTLSAQLSLLQRDTSGLTNENGDLKLQVQTMEQQVRLQDALNDRLRDEVQQLKIATGQLNANNGNLGNFGGLSSYGVNPQSYQRSQMQQQSLLAAQQLQQLQIHSQHQQPQMHMQQQRLASVTAISGRPQDEGNCHDSPCAECGPFR